MLSWLAKAGKLNEIIYKEKGKVKGRKAFKIMGVVRVELGGGGLLGMDPLRKRHEIIESIALCENKMGVLAATGKGPVVLCLKGGPQLGRVKGSRSAGKGGHSHVGFVVQRGSVVFAICREKGGDSLCCARRAWSWICMRMRRVSRECNCVKSLKYICVSLCDCIGHLSKVDLLSIFEF